MQRIAVINLKGGCGKTTLATHLAARAARAGSSPLLVDLDRQQSAVRWVERRGADLPRVEAVAMDPDELEFPEGHGLVVLDVPAGMKRKATEAVIRGVDVVVVPVLPGAFDETATALFLTSVQAIKPVRKGRRPVAVVGNRVRRGTGAERRLDTFLEGLDFPALTKLSESQFYVTAAEGGVTIFDQPPGRVRRALAEWAPLLSWIDGWS
jgi:chromosome partitioning protein